MPLDAAGRITRNRHSVFPAWVTVTHTCPAVPLLAVAWSASSGTPQALRFRGRRFDGRRSSRRWTAPRATSTATTSCGASPPRGSKPTAMRRSMRPSGSSFSASAGIGRYGADLPAVDRAAKRSIATDEAHGGGVFCIRRMRRHGRLCDFQAPGIAEAAIDQDGAMVRVVVHRWRGTGSAATASSSSRRRPRPRHTGAAPCLRRWSSARLPTSARARRSRRVGPGSVRRAWLKARDHCVSCPPSSISLQDYHRRDTLTRSGQPPTSGPLCFSQ